MSPITHLLASWTVASIPKLEKRDRAIITLAGISPDIDGLGIVAELATRHTQQPTITFYLTWKKGLSPLEMISKRADRVFVETFRKRFGKPRLQFGNE